ncbi:endonuclease/exonuclease/phosphatase family protein [Nonlabens ulvanivorans]|uniref:Endonuclease/exonuclease/phosphatase n=1 Tax=Nonlabens ulvanivorans TaxID=906888 RepID=A0A084JTQ9_NONUL|nr:endonuclease/exonuclease/phosphatase [Nonlabens ulvanivorans]KEZ92343.1 endonuclease/exonuclease/phosphatase [Nonlabens ulvanivorans]PRX15176.1 Endonuclease/Exonuclease/phosphatase family protein [Nonlabens ulvanivorans]
MAISQQAFEQYTVAFYNLENLFDVHNDEDILDQDFTAQGRKQWTPQRYQKKLQKLSEAISKVGVLQTGKLPAIIGVAEVENEKVLEDLIQQPKLVKGDYGIIHYNSPDERGIDVALLYSKKIFTVQSSTPIAVDVTMPNDEPDRTRDILYVKGFLSGMPLHIYVNHWPSRRDGADSTNEKRVTVAKQLMDHINHVDPQNDRTNQAKHLLEGTNIIVMGDFNDDPENDSIRNEILPHGFQNVTAPLKKFHRGSLNHNFKWNLFDQIMVSDSLINDVPDALYFHQADIFDDIMLRQWKGKYRGQPARTFVGKTYKGGYSDHFPVYMILRRN